MLRSRRPHGVSYNNHRLYYFAIDGSQYEDCAYAGVSINSRVLLHGQLGNYTGEPIRFRRSSSAETGGI
jgi:hypothetical protein